VCLTCETQSQLTGSRSVWYYEEPIRTVVHGLKYRHLLALQDFLVPRLLSILKTLPYPNSKFVVITSVPLTPHRLAERGFNQSEILARGLSQKTS
jgi:predicted amidophosphoribosyltransferase